MSEERTTPEEHRTTLGSLTSLSDRVIFQDRLDRAIAQSKRIGKTMALVFLNMDNFKDVNHTLGHDAGDTVLVEVAARLTEITRASDSVGRLGGDEFGIIATEVDSSAGAAFLAERVMSAVEKPFEINGNTVLMSCTIGISVFGSESESSDDITPEEILTQADIAADRAKRQGRGTLAFYDEAMGRRTQDRIAMLRDLRGALDRNEFFLEYQPVSEIESGMIVGVEALIRWNRLGKEIVPPLDFIPLAESSGLILPIGEWALRTACTQSIAWKKSGKGEVRVGVNLSPVQFKRQDMVAIISEILEQTMLPANMLDIEITESVLMDNQAKTIETLKRLREMGVSVSVDDFGTGYSSLSYLVQFPIDVLKIDRSFITNLLGGGADDAIAQTVINLGRLLKLGVLAEGVETEEQRTRLASLGCDLAQGPLFSRPVGPDQISKMLNAASDPDMEPALT